MVTKSSFAALVAHSYCERWLLCEDKLFPHVSTGRAPSNRRNCCKNSGKCCRRLASGETVTARVHQSKPFVSVLPPGPSDDVPAGYVSTVQDIGCKTIWSDLGLPRQVQHGSPGLPRGAANFSGIIKRIKDIIATEGVDDADVDDVLEFLSRLESYCKRTGNQVQLMLA
jgi:hypothetical protein